LRLKRQKKTSTSPVQNKKIYEKRNFDYNEHQSQLPSKATPNKQTQRSSEQTLLLPENKKRAQGKGNFSLLLLSFIHTTPFTFFLFLRVLIKNHRMSFFVGLIIGLAVGLALIVGFVKSENARSKLRSELVSSFVGLL
jgi:hypothetical protein